MRQSQPLCPLAVTATSLELGGELPVKVSVVSFAPDLRRSGINNVIGIFPFKQVEYVKITVNRLLSHIVLKPCAIYIIHTHTHTHTYIYYLFLIQGYCGRSVIYVKGGFKSSVQSMHFFFSFYFLLSIPGVSNIFL